MGRQQNNLKYALVGRISGESGFSSVGGHVTDRHTEECKLKPLLHPSDGFSPRCQRYRLFHGLPTSVDPDVVDPVALATSINSPDDDRLLRKAAAQYARHMRDVLGSPELWSATYEPLSRQTDSGKESVCSFLPHEWALVGGVVPVLVPSLRELWLDDEATASWPMWRPLRTCSMPWPTADHSLPSASTTCVSLMGPSRRVSRWYRAIFGSSPRPTSRTRFNWRTLTRPTTHGWSAGNPTLPMRAHPTTSVANDLRTV